MDATKLKTKKTKLNLYCVYYGRRKVCVETTKVHADNIKKCMCRIIRKQRQSRGMRR